MMNIMETSMMMRMMMVMHDEYDDNEHYNDEHDDNDNVNDDDIKHDDNEYAYYHSKKR